MAIINPSERILLGHRVKSGERPCWSMPGGHVEAHETFEAAALRETEEEAGLVGIDNPRVLAVLLNLQAPIPHLTGVVMARVTVGNDRLQVLEPDVFDEWSWFGFSQLPTPLFSPTGAIIAFLKGQRAAEGWMIYSLNPDRYEAERAK